jgi:DnaJ like chaperone protein
MGNIKFFKWVGAALGWILGGFLGALLGFFIGSFLDGLTIVANVNGRQMGGGSGYSSYSSGYNPLTARQDFVRGLLALSAVVMKADGKVVKSELDFVKRFLVAQFGEQATLEMLPELRNMINQQIDVNSVCRRIQQYMPEAQRVQLLHYLFGIAKADGQVAQTEIDLIENMAVQMGVSSADFGSLKAMYFRDSGADYKILEVEPTATDEEVKKAYRKMALKFHPDRVIDLGEEAQKAAKERFQHIQDAYENIRKQRGFS